MIIMITIVIAVVLINSDSDSNDDNSKCSINSIMASESEGLVPIWRRRLIMILVILNEINDEQQIVYDNIQCMIA